jgi:hypothetical protein
VIDTLPSFFGPGNPLRDTPVTPKENIAALFFDRHPYWLPLPGDSAVILPSIYNDRLGRGGPDGITDVFGIEWEWVESAKGSIVRPGEPLLENANEWTDKIKIPDIDAWDWAEEAEKTKLDKRISTQVTLVNGFWFERLVSFMDFAPAAMALIDDDQKDAVKALFAAMTDLGIKLVDKFCEYWPGLDGFNLHDDWAAQRAPFFSQETAYEMFVPYMKALTDHIHSKGRYVTLHSCGRGEARVRCFIDAGFDGWDPQAMNDTPGYAVVRRQNLHLRLPERFDRNYREEEQRRAGANLRRRLQNRKTGTVGFYSERCDPGFTEAVYYSRARSLHIIPPPLKVRGSASCDSGTTHGPRVAP